MKAHFVYVISSQIVKRLYVGMTQDVEKRLLDHNRGKVFSTKGYRPWKVMQVEEFDSRKLARQREKYFKSGIGKEILRSLFKKS